MVDAEDLGFIKDPRHGLVDLPGGIQVVPDRLLHDDPREGSLAARWLDQTGVSKPLHHVGDRGGRDGEVENPVAGKLQIGLELLQACAEVLVRLGILDRTGDVEQSSLEIRPDLFADLLAGVFDDPLAGDLPEVGVAERSEEHTSELQSPCNLVCRLLLEKKKQNKRHSESPLYQS